MSKCPLIAKAIVYAARQAFHINDFGMSWEEIEVNTANIMAGCSVPADGKMNSAEAVANRINGSIQRGLYDGPLVEPDTPNGAVLRVALELVDKYHAQRKKLENQRAHVAFRCRERDEARQERDTAVNKVRELRADLDEMGSNYRRINDLLQDASQDLTRMTTDRDGFRKGAEFWMAQTNAIGEKNAKLRTELRAVQAYLPDWSAGYIRIEETLEQTK